MILANGDETSSAVFRTVCEDDRLEVVGVAFTRTVTRARRFWHGVFDVFRASGLGYFGYVAFINVVFRLKERIALASPAIGDRFGSFFSLRVWASRYDVPVVATADFNAPEFLQLVDGLTPAVIFTRINQVLKRPILERTPHGCWCFHSSELPRHQGIAAEFYALLNREPVVGFTVMKMTPQLDGGPIIRQGTAPLEPGLTLHGAIRLNLDTCAPAVIRRAVDDLVTGSVVLTQSDPSQGSYGSWPSPADTREFHRRGQRFATARELLSWTLN